MSTFYTTFLSKSDFSLVLLLVSFEPLEIQQSNIPLLKALKCGMNAAGAQGCECMSTFCYTPLKIALLLHKMANELKHSSVTVYERSFFGQRSKLQIQYHFTLYAVLLLFHYFSLFCIAKPWKRELWPLYLHSKRLSLIFRTNKAPSHFKLVTLF